MNIILRTETFAKLFFAVSFTGLLMYAVLAFYTFHTAYITSFEPERHLPAKTLQNLTSLPEASRKTYTERYVILKYILVWTTRRYNKNILGEGQEPFFKNNCSHTNCYVTTEMDLLKKYNKEFEVIILDIRILRQSLWKNLMPKERSPKQKYLFHSMRSADETPICDVQTDGYFNWTWSYKILSDISTPFIEVKYKDGYKAAPTYDVHWIENSIPLTEEDIEKLNLKSKKKAVAWMPDACSSRANRFEFAAKLHEALKEHGLELDIYGCFKKRCPPEGCLKMLERDYYFYLAIEPSHSEDYVTREVLKAYHHNTVPIVKGGADYNRFLPNGSYINGGSGSIERIASLIVHSIKNPTVYYNYFTWKNHYTIDWANHNKGLCDLCAMLNNEEMMKIQNNYKQFRKWWYKDLQDRCMPKGAENKDFVVSYLNETREPKLDKFPRKK